MINKTSTVQILTWYCLQNNIIREEKSVQKGIYHNKISKLIFRMIRYNLLIHGAENGKTLKRYNCYLKTIIFGTSEILT